MSDTERKRLPVLPKYSADTAFLPTLEVLTSWAEIYELITTNPGIFAKELKGVNRDEYFKMLADRFPDLPISLQLPKGDLSYLFEEAVKFSEIAPNIVVKVPMYCDDTLDSTTENGKALILISRLSDKGIKTNVTALMNAQQAIMSMRAGISGGKEVDYVSLFFNRIKDGGGDPEREIQNLRAYIDKFGLSTQIIVGSIRDRNDVTQSEMAGAHIVTIPPKIIKSMVYDAQSVIFIDQCQIDYELAFGPASEK